MNEHRRSRTLSVCRESGFLPTPLWLVKFPGSLWHHQGRRAWPLPARQTHLLQKFVCSCDASAIQIPNTYLFTKALELADSAHPPLSEEETDSVVGLL